MPGSLVMLMFLAGLMAWSAQSRHILNCFILLEHMALVLFYTLVLTLSPHLGGPLVILPFFVITVVAAATGLSTLIPLARAKGGDYFSALNVLW